MSEFIEIPGSGPVRITQPADIPATPTRPTPRARMPLKTLLAAAVKMTQENSSYHKRLQASWQDRALEYYDMIGEFRYASHFYARQLARVRYFPAILKEDGTTEPIKSGLPVELLNRIQDPGGGRSQIQWSYGRLMFVTGEGVLFGYRLNDPDERWKFLWRGEVKIRDDGSAVRLDAKGQETTDVGVAYRMWTPHPKHSDEPDSPLRAVLDIAEELLILTASVRSTAVSRMTNGMTIWPSELSPNPAVVGADENPLNNPLIQDYVEHVTAQIENPGSPEGAVPFLLEGSYDYIDRVRWMATHDPQNDYLERELRKECIQRAALGMDMPPEVLLGMTDANHWTAKQVQYDMWRSHGVVKAEQFADDLAESYLRPALEDEGFAGADRIVVDFDDSKVVISPDRTEDAFKAVDRLIISREAVRKEMGWDESMAPDEQEEEFLATLKMRQPVSLEDGELVMPQRGPIAQPSINGKPEDGPAEPSGARLVSRQEARTASAEVIGAAKLALHRCRELAGVRIRHKCKECGGESPDAVVASIVGAEVVTDPMKLVKGGADGFRSFLAECGYEETQRNSLGQMLEVWAAKTIFEPRQPELPSGFVAQIERAREVSDALDH